MQRLEQAGAITIGALNMSEFALGPTGHNAVFGHARNPWNPTRISGGSSSGERYTLHILRRIEAGLFVAASAYLSALSQRSAHSTSFIADTLGSADALILPVLGIPVPRIDETNEAALGASSALVGSMTRWTR